MKKKLLAAAATLGVCIVSTLAAAPARADHCQGDVYCDGRRDPVRRCIQDREIELCSAGSATVDETLR